MRLPGELIKKQFYSSSRDWNKLFWPTEFLNFCFASFAFFLFFFFFVFCSSSFPWSGSLDDVQSTFPLKGCSPSVGRTGLTSGTPPCGGVLPFWGAPSLLAICLRESGPPQDGVPENHQGSGEFSPLGLTASTVRGSGSPLSLFPRGRSPVPHHSASGFLFERQPRDPWGSSWPRLGPSRGGVMAVREAVPKPRIASQVIKLAIALHVGVTNDAGKG